MIKIIKSDIIAFLLIAGLIAGSLLVSITAANKISKLRAENKQLQTQLKQCQETNQQLLNQIQIQQEDYNKAVKELQEASIKPIKRVYIKKVIKQPVYITNEDCQKIGDLIDQAQEQLK
jgi:outer membrane murein-binding lipoprotein Lpp